MDPDSAHAQFVSRDVISDESGNETTVAMIQPWIAALIDTPEKRSATGYKRLSDMIVLALGCQRAGHLSVPLLPPFRHQDVGD